MKLSIITTVFNHKTLIILIFFLAAILRIYNLGSLPPSLSGDELSFGYNASTILNHGVDEHGKPYPLWFEAYGEYKLPVYIYSTVFSLAIFGVNDMAIRLPSAIFGAGTVLIVYFIVKNLLTYLDKKSNGIDALPLLSAFILAISPWHLQSSRTAVESVQALFLFSLGCLLFILFWKKNKLIRLLFSVLFLALSVYTYNSYRILTPLVLIILGFVLGRNKKIAKSYVVLYCIASILLLLPALFFTLSSQGIARFTETSAFTGLNIFFYPLIFLRNFLSYFSFSYLFTFQYGNVENIVYYISPDFGLLYHWSLPFLILGVIAMVSQIRLSFYRIIAFSLFLVPVPAALTISPHPLRALPLAPILSVVIAIGIIYFYSKRSFIYRSFFWTLCLFGVFEIILFAHEYIYHYPNLHEALWGSSRRIVERIQVQSKNYPIIIVNNNALSKSNLTQRLYAPQVDLIFVDDN